MVVFQRKFLTLYPSGKFICHAGAVANVDFKLCRSLLDDHTTSWKVETSSSEAKSFELKQKV